MYLIKCVRPTPFPPRRSIGMGSVGRMTLSQPPSVGKSTNVRAMSGSVKSVAFVTVNGLVERSRSTALTSVDLPIALEKRSPSKVRRSLTPEDRQRVVGSIVVESDHQLAVPITE